MGMAPSVSAAEAIGYLREYLVTVTWDPASASLEAGPGDDLKIRRGGSAWNPARHPAGRRPRYLPTPGSSSLTKDAKRHVQ
jgi:hypothetical protein